MSARPSALVVVTNELVSNPEAIADLKKDFRDYEVHQQLLERLTENAVTLTANKFSHVHIAGGTITNHVADSLYDALKDGGKLTGVINSDSNASLIITGFVHVKDEWTKNSVATNNSVSIPLRRDNDKYKSSKSKAIPIFKRASQVISNNEDDEDGVIDEDELITGETITPAFNFPAKCDPGPGKKRRRACKDCTCGLKDAEEAEEASLKEKQSTVMLNHDEIAEIDFTVPGKAVGGCGSCALGDAFRCDGCPYLGLPPFKPGEVVTVDQFADDF